MSSGQCAASPARPARRLSDSRPSCVRRVGGGHRGGAQPRQPRPLLAAPAVLVPLAWWTAAQARPLAGGVLRRGPAAAAACPFRSAIPDRTRACSSPRWGCSPALLWLPEWRRRAVGAERGAAGAVRRAAGQRGAGRGQLRGGSARRAAWRAWRCSAFRSTCSSTRPTGRARPGLRTRKRRIPGVAFYYWSRWPRRCSPASISTSSFPRRRATGRSSCGSIPACIRRAQGLFYEASTLGNFCAFFLVMIAVAFSRPRAESPVSRKALLAGGAVFFAALVLSYSRASLINVAGGAGGAGVAQSPARPTWRGSPRSGGVGGRRRRC